MDAKRPSVSEAAEPLSMVCQTCQNMLHYRKGRHSMARTLFELDFHHHKSRAELAKCARESACYICQAVCDRLEIDLTKADEPGEASGAVDGPPFFSASLRSVRYNKPALRLDFRAYEHGQQRGKLVASFVLIKKGEFAEAP